MGLRKISPAKKVALFIFSLVVIDQVVKLLVRSHIDLGEQVSVFPWFKLCHIENNGFAFGMQLGSGGGVDWGKIVLSLFRLVMIGFLVWGIRYLLRKEGVPKGVIVGVALILAGAIGNMVDSLFYGMLFEQQGAGFLTGRVVDMFYFPLFKWENVPSMLRFLVSSDGYFFGAVFNVADAYISVAVVYLILFHYKFFK
ncbi:MAG: signal peptidase II [Alistipes sp.]|nr:signal peptidase II [Alistipes sp.]